MNFPLTLQFKKLAISHQIYVTDAAGSLLWYVKQKAFKLKEAITVYGDEGQTRPLYTINADRVIDFSARYKIADMNGRELGTVQRRGMRSFWRAHYEIERGGTVMFEAREENPWAKVGDNLFGELPIIGLFAGYVFHPRYTIARRGSGAPVTRIEKRPSFLQGTFAIQRLTAMSAEEEEAVALVAMVLVLLEKSRC